MDIDYSMRLYELHARFYRRLRNMFSFVTLASGTAVVASVMGTNTGPAIAASFILAALAIIENIVDPAAKSAFYDNYRARFCRLKTHVLREKADIDAIDVLLTELYEEPTDEIEPLRRVALRDNLRAHGHEEWLPSPLSCYERFWAFIT